MSERERHQIWSLHCLWYIESQISWLCLPEQRAEVLPLKLSEDHLCIEFRSRRVEDTLFCSMRFLFSSLSWLHTSWTPRTIAVWHLGDGRRISKSAILISNQFRSFRRRNQAVDLAFDSFWWLLVASFTRLPGCLSPAAHENTTPSGVDVERPDTRDWTVSSPKSISAD